MKKIAVLLFFGIAIYCWGSICNANQAAAQGKDKNDQAVKQDLDQLQGDWYHISREEKGKQVAGESKEAVTSFRGNVIVFKQVGKEDVRVSSVAVLKNMNATSNPKKVDFVITDGINEGMTIHAIYEVKNDIFRYCGGVATRPTSFSTKVDKKDYVYCSTYKRLKP